MFSVFRYSKKIKKKKEVVGKNSKVNACVFNSVKEKSLLFW